MPRKLKDVIRYGVVGAFALLLLVVGFHWTINRIYVNEGHSLLLRYKGPLIFGSRDTAKTGFWAEEGQIGVLAKLRGPGRHFYCPIWWERTPVDDIVIKPGEVGLVTCMLGDALPSDKFLVDGDIGETKFNGILRKVLHPGRFRINPYGYKVETVQLQTFISGNSEKKAGWVEIPTGYVGVVTNLAAGAEAAVAENVLPPGIYPINGREQNIDIVEIGYRHSTVQVKVQRDPSGDVMVDENGEPIIAEQVRKPIQTAFIADELTLTRQQEQLTATEEGTFREAEENVLLASKTVEVDTLKQVAEKIAEGNRTAEGTRAETEKLVAAIQKETAILKADAVKILGEAENKGKQMIEEANADR